MLEKLGGLAVIVVSIAALCLIKILNLPVLIQIFFALVGIFFCLIGIVFIFAQGPLLTKDHWVKKAHKGGLTTKATVS
ncbi:MAG: hypothetical protein KKF00_02230 [Proteobacteria bacterium]|nr:hypothetical protein [Pseudomonadota bacterium]